MFTSRAEFRLSLRADNADQRLTPLGLLHGCVSDTRANVYREKAEGLAAAKRVLANTTLTPHEISAAGIKVSQDGAKRSALLLFSFPDVYMSTIESLCPEFSDFSNEIKGQSAKDGLYAQYLDRQDSDVESLKREEGHVIPEGFDYAAISGLSTELKLKLNLLRPANILQAGRLEGMTPAALLLILAILRRSDRDYAAR